MTQYRRARRLQDAEFANDLHAKREVTCYYDHDGCLVMKARIPADQGELIVKALEMAMEESDDVTAGTSNSPNSITVLTLPRKRLGESPAIVRQRSSKKMKTVNRCPSVGVPARYRRRCDVH